MRINKNTMLFEQLSDEEKTDLLGVCKQIVFQGIVPWDNMLLNTWMTELGFNSPDRRLTMVSIAFPQRAMMSLLVK